MLTSRADVMEAELDSYFNGLRQQVERIHSIIPLLVPNAPTTARQGNVEASPSQIIPAEPSEPQLLGQPAGEDSFEEDMVPLELFKKIESFIWNPDDPNPRHTTFDWYSLSN
jgi:hypothetical protein